MDAPSIKGTGIAQAVHDVNRLVECGRLGRGELEARLEREDLELLDEKIQLGAWYPNESHRRLTELLRDVEGGGRNEYVVRRGRETADRLIEAGLYRQLQLVETGEAGADLRELRRTVRLMLSMSGALYSFGAWSLRDDDGGEVLRVVVEDADSLSDMNRLTAEGFVDRIAERILGYPPRVESARTGPGAVEITIRVDPERTR